MAKRITFMMDDEILEKLRAMQAELILKRIYSVSLSRTTTEVLRKALK